MGKLGLVIIDEFAVDSAARHHDRAMRCGESMQHGASPTVADHYIRFGDALRKVFRRYERCALKSRVVA
jgi:hypothetical protein